MKKRLVYLLLLSQLLGACKAQDTAAENKAAGPGPAAARLLEKTMQTELQQAFSGLLSALRSGNLPAANAYLDGTLGLFVIETPGAVPQARHVQDLAHYRHANLQKTLPELQPQEPDCPLTFADFPAFSCDTYTAQNTGYTADGCFAAPGKPLLSSLLPAIENLDPAQRKQMNEAARKVQYAVLQTYNHTQYYFGRLNGKWKLLFVRLLSPCSA